jgi:uncharacterized repeat protein (TIGR03803 family)
MKTKNKPMKTFIINLFLLPALIAGLNLIPAGRVTAQTFTTLYSFTASSTNSSGIYTNSDGASVYAGLIISGNTLYGTALVGGSSGDGTVFSVNTDGTGFTTLHSFTGGSDGLQPYCDLILSGNTLYGEAAAGGGAGTVFAVSTDGTGFTNLHSFTGGSDGWEPEYGLILSGNILYGTAVGGGAYGNGTIFSVNTNGTGFTNLHSFTTASWPFNINSDGAKPYCNLVLSGNTLYGTASVGGTSGNGTVFAVHTDGTGFTTLHSFTGVSDGANPYAGLILSGNTLYGTANDGGSWNGGTLFAVNTDGSGFSVLHSFFANSDGALPMAGLILSGNTLYGTADYGGSSGVGTVFAVNTNGTSFTNLHSFTGGSGGAEPYCDLVLSGNTLYGTTVYGGTGNGTVFSLSLPPPPPQLTIIPAGANVILTWPTNAAGFTLQSATNLVSPVIWSPVSPGPVVVNGQYAVTNSTSGTNKFYRLIQ